MTCLQCAVCFAPYRHPVNPSGQYSCFESDNRRIIVKSVALMAAPADIPVQVMPPRPSE
jgi:hypothetical protein